MKSFRKGVSVILCALLLCTIIQPFTILAATPQKPAQYSSPGIEIINNYLKLKMNDSRISAYTVQGNPDSSTDNNARLLYGSYGDGTSSVLISVGSNTQIYSQSTSYVNADKTSMYSAIDFNGVYVEQIYSLVYNTYTGRYDTIEMKYVLTNTSSVSTTAGVRYFFDTMLGSNDDAPFRIAGIGDVKYEREFTGSSIPASWQAFDSLTNPSVVSTGTFYTNTAERPDKVQFIRYSNVNSSSWNNSITGSSFGDSAVTIYYNPVTLAPGESRTVRTFYGLGQLVLPDGTSDLGLTASAPSELLTNSTKTEYEGNPFTLNTWLSNTGSAAAENVSIRLELPEELTAEGQSLSISAGDIDAGASKNFSWFITAADQSSEKNVSYKIIVSSDNEDDKEYSFRIKLPALENEHTHNYQTRTTATCTQPGITTKYCACGEETTESVNALGHDYVFISSRKPTCTQDGIELYRCSRCNDERRIVTTTTGHRFGDDNVCDKCGYTTPDNHTHEFNSSVIQPTCTSIGYTLYSCSCGYEYRDSFIEQKGHSWDNGTYTKVPTCTQDGIVKYSCTVCDAERNDLVPATHTWSKTVISEATCTRDGSLKKVCLECGETVTEIIPASHTFDSETTTKEATCTLHGEKVGVCTVCRETITTTIPPLGHEFYNGYCRRCGIGFSEIVTPVPEHLEYGMFFNVGDVVSAYGPSPIDEYGVYLDHNESASLKKVGVYLTQDGTMWRRSLACTGTDITSATYVPYLAYEANIKYTGLSSPDINIFPLSENSDGIWEYGNYTTIGVNLEDAEGNLLLSLYDIGQAGSKTRIFDDLGEMIAWLSEDGTCVYHEESDWIIDSAATCTDNGSKHTVCTVCGKTVRESVIAATGHTPVTEVIREAGCDYPGLIRITCENCDYSKDEYTYAEHNYRVAAITPATCTENGSTRYRCTGCGNTYSLPIEAGHDYVAQVIKQATYAEEGLIIYTCSRCGDSYEETIPFKPRANVLLVQDRLPWNDDSNAVILDALREDGKINDWDKTTTAAFSSMDLGKYDLIIIANDQATSFYNSLDSINDAVADFAEAGGAVIYGACDRGWADGNLSLDLPLGLEKTDYYANRNYIANPVHPIITGESTNGAAITNALLYGNYCSHSGFSKDSLPENAVIILQDSTGTPTLVEYPLGAGRIIASGLTWEYYYTRNCEEGGNTSYSKNAYDDLIVYALGQSNTCDHSFTVAETKESSCTEDAYILYKCSHCSYSFKDITEFKTGHTLSDWTVEREATRQQAGLKVIRCSTCSEIIRSEVIPMLNAPVAYVESDSDSVIYGQQITFTVRIEGSDPIKSLAFEPLYDEDIFDLVSSRWLVTGTLQYIDAETNRAVSAWANPFDVNKKLYEFTLESKCLTPVSIVDSTVRMQDTDGVISLSVVAKNISVVECYHPDVTYSVVGEDGHGIICNICHYTVFAPHNYSSECDSDCDTCGFTRDAHHSVGSEIGYDDTHHWQVCEYGCGEKINVEEHIYDHDRDGTCNTCGYQRFVRGDIDGDGEITSDDAVNVLYALMFGREEYPTDQSLDFNGDGKEDSDDAIYLLYHSFVPEQYPLHF